MIVPTQKGGYAQAQDAPSEANLLMALAEMHKQGRFQVAGDVVNARTTKGAPWPATTLELGKAMQGSPGGYQENPNEVAKGVMQGKVKVLNPAGR